MTDERTAWGNANVAAGLCRRCGTEPLVSKMHCQACLELARAEASTRRAGKIAQGLCTSCGTRPIATKTMCRECADKATAKIRARADLLRAKGLCAQCGKEPLVNAWNCQRCLDRKNAQRNAAAHGMSLDIYLAWIRRGCDICGSTTRLDIDHDHTCHDDMHRSCPACNRGVLCRPHNYAVKVLEQSDALAVLAYLVQTRSSAPLVEHLDRAYQSRPGASRTRGVGLARGVPPAIFSARIRRARSAEYPPLIWLQ